MNKTSTPLQTVKWATMVLLSCCLMLTSSVKAQQAYCTWGGASNQQSSYGGIGVPPCGSTGQVNNIGSGTYTYVSLTAGKTYTFSNAGGSWDSQMSLWYYYGSGNANGNNGGWGPISWNDDNGPEGGTGASFTITAPYTSGSYILVVNRYSCNLHGCFTSGCTSPYGSTILRYREEGTPTTTATASSPQCVGQNYVTLGLSQPCQSHTLQTGMYEQFNTASVALNYADYTPRWTKNGDVLVDGSKQCYLTGAFSPSWGSAGLWSNETVSRTEGRVLQGRFYSTGSSIAMLGWHDGGTGWNYADLVHAFYVSNGSLLIYEDGNYRADVTSIANTIGGGYGTGRWINFRIVLHSGASNNQGATYYLKGSSGSWVVVYHSNYSAESNLRFGVSQYNNATLYIDDIFLGGATQFPATTGLSAGTFTYAAADQFGQVDEVTVSTTNAPAAPATPTQEPATNVSCTTFTANWLSSANATYYLIDVSTSPSFTSYVYQNLNTGNANDYYNFSGMTPGVQYFYRVRAANSCGVSGYNLNTQVNMLPPAPLVPNIQAASSVTCNSFTANWNHAPDAATYYIDLSTSSSFSSFVVNNANTGYVNSYNFTGLTYGITYYYRVRSSFICGTSASSTVVPVDMPPAAAVPTIGSATNIGCSSFTANWSSAANATTYYLYVSTSSSFSSHVINGLTVGNTSSYNVTGLSAGNTYYFRVKSGNSCGASGYSTSASAQMLPATPAVPSSLGASNLTCSSFTANWSASANTQSYYIDIASDAGFSNLLISNENVGTATSYTYTGTAGSTYYYRVRAENVCGLSASSTPTTVDMLPAAPVAPAATSANNIGCTSFDAAWPASANATQYYLDVSSSSTFASYLTGWQNTAVGNVTSVTISGLTAGSTYYYRVKAENVCGTSAYSATVTTAMQPAQPGTPLSSTALNIGCTSLDARWLPTARATGYYLDVATNITFTNFVPGWNNTLLGPVTTTTISGLNPGTIYYYRVRATNSCGTSANSITRNATTLPPAPAAPLVNTASSVGCTDFTFGWGTATNASTYYIDVATDPGFTNYVPTWQNRSFASTTTFATVSGLSTGTTYYYRMRAGNTCGISGNSNVQSVLLNAPPVITSCPGDVTFNNNPDLCSSVVTYPSAIATGTPTPSISYSIASGTVFPLGTTNILVTASNSCGTTNCDFDVTVVDNQPPTIECPAQQILPLNSLCQVSVPDYIRAAVIYDNCSSPYDPGLPANQQTPGSIIVTQDPPVGTIWSGQGTHTVTLTAVDSSGNINTCSFFVSVEDQTPPTALCQNGSVDLDATGAASITSSLINAGSYDNCGVASTTADPATFSCLNVGANLVTLTVIDINGNSSACVSTVTVNDVTAPVAACQDVTVQLDATGNGSITADQLDNGSSDACGIASYSSSVTAFTCANVGDNPATLTVTDVNGNSSSCSATITVEDNVAPDAVCQDVTVQLDASGNGSLTAAQVDNGSSDACGVASLALNTTSFTCANVGPNAVTLTVTDVNGNSSSCGATATVEDNIAPIALCQNLTVSLDAAGAGSITPAQVDNGSNDACGIASLALDNTDFTCANVGANNVTLTATDVNGNSASCSATITVEDHVAPVASCQNITVQLDATGNTSIAGADVDNGSNDACGIASLSVSPDAFTCANVGANGVVLTVTDNNGNVSSCAATVTVEDNVAPIAVCQDITIQLDAAGLTSIAAADIDGGSSDACGIASLSSSKYNFDCSNVGANALTLTVLDVNGNASSCAATVTVEDNVAPIAVCQDITIQLDAAGLTSIAAADIDGGSSDACGIASLTSTQYNFDCSNVGANALTLTVVDVNGNSSTCGATVTVEDNVAPIATCQNISVYLDSLGNTSIVAADIDGGSSDACGIASLAASQTAFDCSHFGNNTIELLVTDVNGNQSTCNAIVDVIDLYAPTAICQGITLELDATGNGSITPSQINNASFDACGIATIELDNTDFNCANVGNNVVILTVTDIHSNISTCTGVVTVQDNIAPIAICQDINSYLDTTGNASITAESIDNGSNDACGIASLSVSPNAFNCSNVGPNPVTLTVTDVNGNISTCMSYVQVIDDVEPIALCRNNTIQLDALGVAILSPSQIDNGSNDACGIASLAVSKEEFSCENVGPNTVTLIVTDVNGLITTCDATVTVQDKVPAVAACQNLTIQLDANGAAFVTAEMLDAGSNDACGIDSLGSNVTTFSCANVGANSVTLTVVDVNGNVSECTSIVTVEDNVAPTALCQEVTVTLDNTGFAGVTPTQVDNGSFDNCGIQSMTVAPNTFGCANIGSNAVTLTVTDVNGNVSTCVNNVKVIGQLPTCFITPIPANNTYTGGIPTNIYLGYGPQTVTLQTTMTGGTPQYYSWSGSNLSCYNCANPVFAPTATGVYNFTATITNNFGCVTTCTITICVLDVRAQGGKVYLSHYPGNGKQPCNTSGNGACNNLTISVNAVAAHLAHPCDHLGLCNGSGTQICQTSAKMGDDEEVGVTMTETAADDFKVKVYPNPFSDVFRLDVSSSSDENLEVRIYDVLGQLIMGKKGIAYASNVTFGEGLSKGVYLVEVAQGEKLSVIRIIKSE